MKTLNHTGFSALPFWSLDPNDKRYLTVVVRGTYKIGEDFELTELIDLELDESNEEHARIKSEIIVTDLYYGESDTSSIQWANDLSSFKPNTDIHIMGSALSENNEPRSEWAVKVQIGELQTELTVHAPREWQYTNEDGWQLTEQQTCTTVPLRYEYASGGTWGDEEKGGFSESNPIGRGCCDPEELDKGTLISAPQILAAHETIPKLGETVSAKGLGAQPPSWPSRLQHAGTYDAEWEDNQHPLPPHDFNHKFFNSAAPELIYNGYLKGDETVTLTGLHPQGEFSFDLTSTQIHVHLTDTENKKIVRNATLDTLQVDLDLMLVYLVWRVYIETENKIDEMKITKRHEDAKR